MKEQTRRWRDYAEENLRSAEILLESGLFNPCLQNAQQAVEKCLKAVCVERNINLRKTHSISELVRILTDNRVGLDITDEQCDLLDAVYLPSKYPLGGVLPDFQPDASVANGASAWLDDSATR